MTQDLNQDQTYSLTTRMVPDVHVCIFGQPTAGLQRQQGKQHLPNEGVRAMDLR